MEILKCEIISENTNHLKYRVYDKDNNTIAEWCSSNESWVKHDAGWYHTKDEFDKKYPEWWIVEFDF